MRSRLIQVALPVLTVLLMVTGCGGGRPTQGTEVVRQVEIKPPPPPPPPTVRVTLVGDVMLARRPGEAVAKGVDPFAAYAKVFAETDLAIGNLECVVATVGEEVPKAYNFRCHPRVLPYLGRYFHALSVANNHSGDYGPAAFAEQLDLLKQAGIPYFGGGKNLKEAHTPLIFERNGLKIALLAYNEVELRSFAAGPERPGLAWSEDELVVRDIVAARKEYGADLVLVYPHWGYEYLPHPSVRQQQLAHKMIDAGADLVVGNHPHVVQTVEYYKGKLIVYSLGNFVFDDFLDVPEHLNEPSRLSWVLRLTLGRDGVQKWDTLVARTDDQGIPRPVSGAVSPCGVPGTTEIRSCKND